MAEQNEPLVFARVVGEIGCYHRTAERVTAYVQFLNFGILLLYALGCVDVKHREIEGHFYENAETPSRARADNIFQVLYYLKIFMKNIDIFQFGDIININITDKYLKKHNLSKYFFDLYLRLNAKHKKQGRLIYDKYSKSFLSNN